MPLVYQHNINDYTKLAVWHITENENFFISKVPLSREISHWHKRLQHLAGRYLLQEMFPDFPYQLIEIAGTKRPFLPNDEYHFSISHCGDYAAAFVSKDQRVGIDIELFTPRVLKIKNKFLHDSELQFANGDIKSLVLLWSAKEAMYKWFATGGIDFKQHLRLFKFDLCDTGTIDASILKGQEISLSIHYKMMEEFVLAYCIER